MSYPINAEVSYNDQTVIVLDYAKGWYTVLDGENDKHKCRAAALSELVDDERTINTQMKKARAKYVKAKNYAGESTMDCGDNIAELLRGLEPHEVCLLADSLYNEPEGYHGERYSKLNAGQQRMNSGNRIRGGLKKELFTPDDVSKAYSELGLEARGQEA